MMTSSQRTAAGLLVDCLAAEGCAPAAVARARAAAAHAARNPSDVRMSTRAMGRYWIWM